MTGTATIVAGFEIPTSDPVFLAVVGVHVLLGLACTITGAIAMLSTKRIGRHPLFGSIYYWCISGVFVTASALATVRWAEDYHRNARLCGRIPGAHGASQALEQLGEAAHHRDGVVIRAAVDRLLCRQREELAPLERTSSDRLVADPGCCWVTTDCSCAVAASLGQDAAPASSALGCCPSIP